MHLKAGDPAPSFELPDQDGKTHQLSDYAGKKLFIYFYPKADTPGCTKQSCAISENLAPIGEAKVAVLGVSPDKPEAQKAFDAKYKLGFPLLADEEHAMADAYGCWGEKSMYGNKYMGIIRSAFLIDEGGKLEAVWYKISPAKTVPSLLKALK